MLIKYFYLIIVLIIFDINFLLTLKYLKVMRREIIIRVQPDSEGKLTKIQLEGAGLSLKEQGSVLDLAKKQVEKSIKEQEEITAKVAKKPEEAKATPTPEAETPPDPQPKTPVTTKKKSTKNSK